MSNLKETMEKIRTERQRLRSFPNYSENNRDNYKDSGGNEDNSKSANKVDSKVDDKVDSKVDDKVDDKINNKVDDKIGSKPDYNIENIENIDIAKLKRMADVEKLLAELKRNEPTSDNQFFRLSVIAYEIGDLHRSIVYSERFKNDPKIRAGHLANGKLALADALTQLYLLCISLEWDFNKLRELGAQHLAERHLDFKRDGWSEIN